MSLYSLVICFGHFHNYINSFNIYWGLSKKFGAFVSESYMIVGQFQGLNLCMSFKFHKFDQILMI